MEQGLSDAEVAAAMPDMTVRAARRFREKLRILRKRGGTKKQRILESGWLGTMSDVEVAAKLGVSVGYVRFVRTNEGIPAFDESVGPARDKP
jgi:hypothetical protein